MSTKFISKLLNNNRMAYLLDSALGTFDLDRQKCPSCGATKNKTIATKYVVPRLKRCSQCRLLFRTPIDKTMGQEDFYDLEYDGGPVTDLPSEEGLDELKRENFISFPNSCWHRIDLLERIGIPKESRILDYGASWGYATYQWQQRGYKAEGFELSQKRAAFGKKHLGMSIATSPEELTGLFDVVYSCHVIEHIANLSSVVTLAKRILKPGGLFIAFTPNGSDERRQTNPSSWIKQWGHVHPLYLDKEFYVNAFSDKKIFLASPPYENIKHWDRASNHIGDVSGSEILIIAQM
jgi:2-polyprenyl-3-methyl-5-hydroxy-6-metoxy-1,4-benzoquinol methylase